ncbi:MAG: hypothetical protein QM778_28715 [Myxococcales bacterium]
MRTKLVLWGLGVLLFAVSSPAHAQVQAGRWRVFMDVDMFNGGVVQQDPRGPLRNEKFGVIGFGPNQLGSSRAVIGTPPVGVGFDYVLRPAWMLGLRSGLGYDRMSNDDLPDIKVFALSLMPEVTAILPHGGRTKIFGKFSPIVQFDQLKLGDARSHIFMGCFSIGAGAMFFLGELNNVEYGANFASSLDIGFYFEGRFGRLKLPDDNPYIDVDDLRGVLRVGLSFWTGPRYRQPL